MKAFKFFRRKEKTHITQNLPDLVRKINKNELIDYTGGKYEEINKTDPLYLRINIEDLDYIKECQQNKPFYQKYFTFPIIRYIAKFNFTNFRFSKEIYRPNVNLREMYFGILPDRYKASVLTYYIVLILLAYVCGYIWARLKYDIPTRKFMYVFIFSYMMVFEHLDNNATSLLDFINSIIPLEMSDTEMEYIIYYKLTNYLTKRSMKNKIDAILGTDPELFEIDEIIKKIK